MNLEDNNFENNEQFKYFFGKLSHHISYGDIKIVIVSPMKVNIICSQISSLEYLDIVNIIINYLFYLPACPE